MPEQQIDPRLLDQTRREITKLVSEIEELAGRDIPAAEFYAEYLRLIATSLASRAATLWMRTPQGNLQLAYQINLHAVGLDSDPFARQCHDELLRYAVLNGKPIVVPPHTGPGEESDGAKVTNPTDFLLILAPIQMENQTVGVIEIFQDASRRFAAQQGYVRFLGRLASEAAKYLRNRQYRQLLSQQQVWNQLDAYLRSVHGGLNPKQVAYLIANDGRKLIGCERVSVAIQRRTRTAIEAISGQDIVERRSNLVQRMARLADCVLRHGENLLYTGTVEEHWPADVTAAMKPYLEESGSKLVAVVPMEDQREFGRRGKATAALVVEMIEDNPPGEEMGGRIEMVARHGALALYNALEYHRVFLLPVWRAIGTCTQSLTGRALPKVITAVAAIAGLTAALVFVSWPLRLEGRGKLVPEVRRIVYAPMDGTIRSVKVEREDLVDSLSPLTEMSNPELELEEKRSQGERLATEQALNALFQQRESSSDADLGSKINQTQEQLRGLEQQLRLIEEEKKRLQITSPIRGRVMDWNPKEKLLSRPVKQGDSLLEIADVEGRWIIEVQLSEDTITHIGRARQRSSDDTLPVTYVISASPDRTYRGTLYQVSTQARTVDQENVVEGRVALDESVEKPPREWAGVEVRVKVDCGPHALGYVLFRELIDFVREYVFF